MPSVFDSDIDKLAKDAREFFDGWSELLLLPLSCLGGIGGGANHYRSVDFTVPAASVSRVLAPDPLDPLKVGIARFGRLPEQIPDGALRFQPSVLAAGVTTFHLVVDAGKLAGVPGGTYWGTVKACVDPNHPQVSDDGVRVWFVIR